MGIAEIITAIATTVIAIYAVISNRSNKMRYNIEDTRFRMENTPVIKATVIRRHAEYVLVHFQFFPARFPVLINKISSNAEGIAPSNDEEMRNVKGTRHDESVNVHVDVPPLGVSLMAPSLYFSFRLRSNQSSLDISMHSPCSSCNDLTKQYKITIIPTV